MNINFCGKLIIDKSFNSLKQSDKEEIIALTKRVLDSPKIQEIIPEDIVLLGKNSKKGDIVEIRYGKSSFEINSIRVSHSPLFLATLQLFTVP